MYKISFTIESKKKNEIDSLSPSSLSPCPQPPRIPPPPPLLSRRRATIALQAAARGHAARVGLQARRDAATEVAAWWRGAAEARRYRLTRRRIVTVQSLVRGRRDRQEVAARWAVLGRRFSKHKAATMIQVRVLHDVEWRADCV